MNYYRILFFILIMLLAATGPVWVLVGCGLFYIFYYRSIEILFIAFAIDAFYGYQYEMTALPATYTITTAIALMLAVFSERVLMVYNQSNNV